MSGTEHPGEPEQKQNNFENVLNLNLQQLIANANANNDKQHLSTLSVDELFEFLEKHFNVFRNNANLQSVLPFIHQCLRLFARRDYTEHDIGMIMLNFYEEHKESDKDLIIVVQIFHQILYSLNIYKNKEISVARKVFAQLTKQLPTIKDRKLVSNIIACLQLYMKMYSGNNELMLMLWTDLSQLLIITSLIDSVSRTTHVDILMQLFDEFSEIYPNIYNDENVVATIQILLTSVQREDRKCGYYLFKKTIQCLTKSQTVNNIWFSSEYSQQMKRSWISYITILENLEENQSHLIMPSLQNLNELITGKQLQSSWMDILLMRILTHKNNLVLRWSIVYLMDTFTCSDLHRDIVKQLLQASNSNTLYNYEGYFIDKEHFSSFLKGDLSKLYEVLGEINWKSIPLFNLLRILNENDLPKSVTYEQVLAIASRVRALQDCYIRKKALLILNTLFNGIVDKMTMAEYVTYVEALYNTTDKCYEFQQLYEKRPTSLDLENENIFKGRFYEILVANIENTTPEEFTNFLNDIPVQKHGWLKLLPFHFDFENANQMQFACLYGLNINEIFDNSLFKIFENFDLHLRCDSTDRNECEQRSISAIAFFVHNMESLDDKTDNTFRTIFNYKLTEKIIRKLCCCLQKTQRLLDKWTIDNLIELVASVKTDSEECYYLCSYLERNNLFHEYFDKMIEKCPKFVMRCDSNILNYLNRPDFFCDDIKKGDLRIEECYRFNLFGSHTVDTCMRYVWLRQIKKFGDNKFVLYLLNCHKDITKKKQRYFANSYEHRLKMRIALGLSYALLTINISEYILDTLWNILLNENNQLNINYFYEYIIGSKDKRATVFLEKLQEAHTLTSSQQVSIMSATFTFCMRQRDKLNDDARDMVVMNLMSLTMGANFHTRLFAQMVLYTLLNNDGFNKVSCRTTILESIKVATRGNLSFLEHLNDIRLYMHTFAFIDTAWEIILYVTNVPYDEIVNELGIQNFSKEMRDRLAKCRLSFSKKMSITTQNNLETEVNDQLQRKMNPSTDVLEPNNLLIYPAEERYKEMFVIASLIDKLPNLGGIARTCEVLGIQNLIMESKKDVEKNDFKNISMTAEKSLEIIEVKLKDLRDFIINKQKEGFAVVGAEQTSKSENFVNFKFPQKCVLLLGHEKDGIPPTLLGLLDYAVEIPQFGQVRSLNVHVTGALFMWEYCKQHLV